MFLDCIEICHHENIFPVTVRFKPTLNYSDLFCSLVLQFGTGNKHMHLTKQNVSITQVIYCSEIAVVKSSVIWVYGIGLLNTVNLHNSVRASNASVKQLNISLRNGCHVVAKWGISCQVIQSSSGDVSPRAGEIVLYNLVYSKEVCFTCIHLLLIFLSRYSSLLFPPVKAVLVQDCADKPGCFSPEFSYLNWIWPVGHTSAVFFNGRLRHYF